MPGTHALLSPSSATRWLNCPASARLCENIPDTESIYAKEGTLAHEMCEVKLLSFVSATPKRTVTARLNKLKKSELYNPEMDGYTDVYVDYVKKTALGFSAKAIISVEKPIDYSNYVPSGFGTSDCIIVQGGDLFVIDFKYGKGVSVSAEDNAQMKLYAIGALNLYAMFYLIKTVHLVIVQPRLDNISEWSLSVADLLQWAEGVKPIAQLAYEGKGEMKSGDHCKFCKVKATCRKRAEDNLALGGVPPQSIRSIPSEAKSVELKSQIENNDNPTLSDDEVGEILQAAKNLKDWVESLNEYALKKVLDGGSIKGWKAVEGKGSRNWTADSTVLTALLTKANYPTDIAFERKMLSVAQLEKVIGKTEFEKIFFDSYEKTKGKPTLAPISDKRPDYVQGTTAKEDFK